MRLILLNAALLSLLYAGVQAIEKIPLCRTEIDRQNHMGPYTTALATEKHLIKNQTITASHEKRSIIYLPVRKFYDLQAYTNIKIGTPPQSVRVAFDTGSANTWVFSQRCNTDCCRKRRYDCSKSHSYTPAGIITSLEFWEGQTSGFISQDRITLGDLSVPNALFFEVHRPDSLTQLSLDGIIGLAYPDFGTKYIEPLFDVMMRNQLLDSNVFGFYLPKYNTDNIGELTLGGWNKDLVAGEIKWVPVSHKGAWQVKLDGILIDNDQIDFSSGDIVIDTGIAMILLDERLALTINLQLGLRPQENMFVAEPHYLKFLPDITFKMNGINFNLPSSAYMRCFDDRRLCISLIEGIPWSEPTLFALGQPFLSYYYSVYSRQNDEVGFAKAKN